MFNNATDMAATSLSGILIAAIGSYVPEERVPNSLLAPRFGKDEHFLEHKLGFVARAIKPASMKTSDMCVRAFEDLEQHYAIDRSRIELLVVVTQNPDQKIPHTSAIVHQKLGVDAHCATFDISQGCAGYTVGQAAVSGWMSTLGCRNAVLLTCDPYSEIVDPHDPATAMVFGDAATATLLSSEVDQGYRLQDAALGTLPESSRCLTCEERFFMDGRQVSMNVMSTVPSAMQALLARNSLSFNDISYVLLHQASRYVIETMRSRLELSNEKAPFAASSVGNCVSSSIPLLMKEIFTRNDSRFLLIFGIGFSWSIGLLEKVKKEF